MRRKIPNTSLLIAFDSAARHLSFTRAGEELSLTESAVSRKIAMLEAYLSIQLFSRVKRRLQLTDAGDNYAVSVRQMLNKLEVETALTMAHDAGHVSLEIAVLPTFALKWLMPRLREFNALHRSIIVNITAREEPFLFSEHAFDATIHFDHPVWANSTTTYLFTEKLVPVCSPQLLKSGGVNNPDELTDFVLMHKTGRAEAWSRWFELAGVTTSKAFQGPRYSMYALAIESARNGDGIALVPHTYVADDIASNQLVVPWNLHAPGSKDYFFVVPERKQSSNAVQLFRDWLVDASRHYRDEPGRSEG